MSTLKADLKTMSREIAAQAFLLPPRDADEVEARILLTEHAMANVVLALGQGRSIDSIRAEPDETALALASTLPASEAESLVAASQRARQMCVDAMLSLALVA